MEASRRIPVSSDPARCAEDLLQCAEHVLLQGVVASFSQDLSLGMCLERQSQLRLAAKISLPHLSDLSPRISQNLGLLCRTLPYPLVHSFFSRRQGLVSAPIERVEALVFRGWLGSTKRLHCSWSEGCQAFPQGGVCVFWTQAIRGDVAGSVLGSKYKEKSDRAHIHQNGVILPYFSHTVFFLAILNCHNCRGEHAVVCDLPLCSSFTSCSAEMQMEVASLAKNHGLV